jgi:biotin transport system substrate-specific component
MNRGSSATLIAVLAARRDDAPYAGAIRIASVLFMTALTAAAAQISILLPFTSVPLTLQPMVVLLAALALGPRLAMVSQILYLAAGIAGLPVFAASAVLPPGPLRLLGPTGGYLMAYPVASYVTGALAERGFDRRYLTSVLAMCAGLAVIYCGGTLWLAFFARSVTGGAQAVGLSAALAAGVYPFVAADVVKLLIAAGIVPGLWRLFGYLPSTSKY